MKVCPYCCINKPLSAFYNSKRTKDGKQCMCKECENDTRSRAIRRTLKH